MLDQNGLNDTHEFETKLDSVTHLFCISLVCNGGQVPIRLFEILK